MANPVGKTDASLAVGVRHVVERKCAARSDKRIDAPMTHKQESCKIELHRGWRLDLDKAVEQHVEWKVRFRMAIFQKEPLDAACIGKDDCCELGNWLHGEAKSRFSSLGTYDACVARHKAFHEEAGKIARAINAAQYAEATEMLKSSAAFSKASSEVGLAIMAFKKEAAMASSG